MSSNPRPASSLHRQLLWWLLAPLLLLFCVNSVLGYRVAIATANEAFDRLLLASVKAIADRVSVVGDDITVDIPYVALELFESNIRERIFYKVTGPDGATLTGYEDLPAPPVAASAQAPGKPVFFRGEYHGENLYEAALYKPLYAPSLKGMVLIQVGETAESREALSRRILYDSLLPQGLLITFSALFLVLGARRALQPLRQLRDGIARRPSTDLTPVDASGVQSEVQPLIHALNEHTGRIARMIDSRVAFVADAAHQIRTRLSILRTQIDYGRKLDDPESLHAVLAEAGEIVDEAARFFNQLLLLAHAEAKALPGQDRTHVDIARLAHEAALEHVRQARRRQINLAFEGSESGLAVQGSAVLLHELLANVLDNAIRYTQVGGNVTVRAASVQDEAVIEIEDNGPGIPASLRARAFERFFRVEGTEGEGSGLGLAIAAEICRSQQASISLRTPQGGYGLLAVIQLRLAPAQPTFPESSAAIA